MPDKHTDDPMLTQRRRGAEECPEAPVFSAPPRLRMKFVGLALFLLLLADASIRAEVTAEQVNNAISRGVAYLEKMQPPNGRWTDYPSGGPGGTTALCT